MSRPATIDLRPSGTCADGTPVYGSQCTQTPSYRSAELTMSPSPQDALGALGLALMISGLLFLSLSALVPKDQFRELS
jgi:hypothetical protein